MIPYNYFIPLLFEFNIIDWTYNGVIFCNKNSLKELREYEIKEDLFLRFKSPVILMAD